MAKYIVKKRFKDKETKKTHEEGTEIDITVKRGDEINKNLKAHGEIVSRVHKEQEV